MKGGSSIFETPELNVIPLKSIDVHKQFSVLRSNPESPVALSMSHNAITTEQNTFFQ